MSFNRVLPIFAAAFAVAYAIAVEANLAAITYHPRTGEWDLWAQPARSGPAMYWYGWLITAAAGAVGVSLISIPLTRNREPPVWIGWAIPLATMIAFVYFLRSYFIY